MKIKTVEALAYGKPLVTTEVGGEGLEDGWESAFRVATTPDQFVGALAALLTDETAAYALGKRARVYAELAQTKALQSLADVLEIGG